MGEWEKNTQFSTVPFYSLFVIDKTPNCSPENHVIPQNNHQPPYLDDKMITGCLLSRSAIYFL